MVLDNIQVVTNMIAEAFPNIQIFPSIGKNFLSE
jgi:hypothetical protein